MFNKNSRTRCVELERSIIRAWADVSFFQDDENDLQHVPTEMSKIEPSAGQKREREDSREPEDPQIEQSIVRSFLLSLKRRAEDF